MKKSLFALAAVGAFAGAAQAQSSVTVYGLLDYGYQGASNQYTGSAVNSSRTSGLAGNGESTSRLGFRGTEDLGGGKRAFFTVETSLNTDTSGAFGSDGGFTASSTGNRQMFLGLGQKGLGTVSFGVQYTPIHEAVAATDAGGTNNQNGNVIYDRRGGFGSNAGQVVAGGGINGQTASGMTTNSSYTVRTTNSMVLKSENMAGFSAKALVSYGSKSSSVANPAAVTAVTSGGAATNVNNFGVGVGLDYTWKKLYVTANFQQFTDISGQTSGATYFAGYNGGAITPGINARDTQQYYAASYDFGVLKAFVQAVDRKVANTNNANQYSSRSAQQIAVRAPITPAVVAWASAGMGKINATGTNGPSASFTGWQIGSDYSLSKRTNLYAIYGQTQTSNAQASTTINSQSALTSATPNASYNANSYAVGVRHTF